MDTYYTVREVAKLLKVDYQTIMKMIKDNKIEIVRTERAITIHRNELEKRGIKCE